MGGTARPKGARSNAPGQPVTVTTKLDIRTCDVVLKLAERWDVNFSDAIAQVIGLGITHAKECIEK